MRSKKGVVGLNILLSVVVMLFVAGLLIFIYSFIGGEVFDEVLVSGTSETLNSSAAGLLTLTKDAYSTLVVTFVGNATNTSAEAGITTIPVTEYTIDYDANTVDFNLGHYNSSTITASYTEVGSASESINTTRASINTTVDWFGIIIVITAMVVLILLTTIIIRAIRGGGLTGDGGKDMGSA